MSKTKFIEEMAAYVRKYAPLYGICVYSPIIAQGVLESGFGTSYKATHGHNYHGLKHRPNRVSVSIGTFEDKSIEDRGDHNEEIIDKWFKFANMEDGIHGYFQFINISNYANLKGVTDPKTYLENIKADKYASDDDYVEKVMNVIEKYNLTKYDNAEGVKMAKVFLSAGHGGSDPGAVAFGLKEKDINLQALLACKSELEAHGVDVICSRVRDENDPVGEEVKEANASGCDLAVSFHANAGGGDGFEAFCNLKNAAAVKLAKLAEKHVKELGQNSRGIKSGLRLSFIKKTTMTAVLFESFFVDNDADNNIGDTLAEQKKFGVAYAKAILEFLEIPHNAGAAETAGKKESDKIPESNDKTPYTVKITASALNVRAGAGTEHKINTCVKMGEVFTITEVKNGWGKLKSGAGWINLKYTVKC